MSRRFSLENRTGYHTGDLRRFFARGFRAMRMDTGRPVHIVVSAAPQRSRGCAEVRGDQMSIALAPPARFSMRRLARLFEHESAHIAGLDHDKMPRNLLLSLGPTPSWARTLRIRYLGRAPDQMSLLRSKRHTRA